MNKISIRFFDDKEVRAIWGDESSEWWFSVVDIVGVLSRSADSRNYWYVLKNRLKKIGSEVLTNCKGFKLVASDGKRRMTDCLTERCRLLLLLTSRKTISPGMMRSERNVGGNSMKRWKDRRAGKPQGTAFERWRLLCRTVQFAGKQVHIGANNRSK